MPRYMIFLISYFVLLETFSVKLIILSLYKWYIFYPNIYFLHQFCTINYFKF